MISPDASGRIAYSPQLCCVFFPQYVVGTLYAWGDCQTKVSAFTTYGRPIFHTLSASLNRDTKLFSRSSPHKAISPCRDCEPYRDKAALRSHRYFFPLQQQILLWGHQLPCTSTAAGVAARLHCRAVAEMMDDAAPVSMRPSRGTLFCCLHEQSRHVFACHRSASSKKSQLTAFWTGARSYILAAVPADTCLSEPVPLAGCPYTQTRRAREGGERCREGRRVRSHSERKPDWLRAFLMRLAFFLMKYDWGG